MIRLSANSSRTSGRQGWRGASRTATRQLSREVPASGACAIADHKECSNGTARSRPADTTEGGRRRRPRRPRLRHRCRSGSGLRGPGRRRRGAPVAGPAGSDPAGRGRHRGPPAHVGGAGLVAHAQRRVLHRQALQLARADWRLLATGHRRPGRTSGVAQPGRPQGQAQARGRLHSRMLGQSRPALLDRRDRQRQLGRHLAGRRAEAGQAPAERRRGGVLGSRPGHRDHPGRLRNHRRRASPARPLRTAPAVSTSPSPSISPGA